MTIIGIPKPNDHLKALRLRKISIDNPPLSFDEIHGLASIYFPAEKARIAAEIAIHYSQGDCLLWMVDPDDRRGLWQLPVNWYPDLAELDLFDPLTNAAMAAFLCEEHGWSALYAQPPSPSDVK